MADITLAECNGGVWLVGGEDYIDDLLINTLPPDITIEFVQCASKDEVRALWVQNCGEPDSAVFPWIIHPNIAARIRRASPDYSVFFTQWSAFLDDDAQAVIREAANWAAANETAPVQLVSFLDPAGPQPIADLTRLRAHLVEDKLAEHGLDRARIGRAQRDVAEVSGMAQESQRIDIVVRPA